MSDFTHAAAAAVLLLLPLTGNAAAHDTRSDQDGCAFDQRHLPRTADAVDGWYRSCRLDASRSGGGQSDQ